MRLFVFIVGYFYGSSWATGNPKMPDESENENFDTSLTISDALGSSLTTKLQDENFFDTSVTNVDALGTSMIKSVPGNKVLKDAQKDLNYLRQRKD